MIGCRFMVIGMCVGATVTFSPVGHDAHAQRGGQHLNSPGYQRALEESRRRPPSAESKRRSGKPTQLDERQRKEELRRCGGNGLCINPVF